MSDAPLIRTLEPSYCFATWDNALIQVWRGGTTSESVVKLGEIARRFVLEKGRTPISSIALVEAVSPAPDDKIRAELSAFYREFAPQMKEQIVIAEGSGFRAALVRSVGITLSMLAPRKLPFKFCGTVREAAVLIAPHLTPRAGGAAGLLGAIEGLRGEITARLSSRTD